MARIHGGDARIYADQFNLSGRANTLDLEFALPTREVTAFEDAAQTFVQGKNERGWTAEFGAFLDITDDEIDEILDSLQAATAIPLWGFYLDGSAAGSRGYEGSGWIDRRTLRTPVNNAGVLSATVRGSNVPLLGRAMKLNEATAVTGTANGTGQNHMASASGDRVVLITRVTAVDGAGSVTFKLQESSDNGSGDAYADVAGMGTNVHTAVGAKATSVLAAATLGPWYRIVVSAFSGFTSVTLRGAVAIVPGG